MLIVYFMKLSTNLFGTNALIENNGTGIKREISNHVYGKQPK